MPEVLELTRKLLSHKEHSGVAAKILDIYVILYFLFHACFVAGLYSTRHIQIGDELYSVISVWGTLVATILLVRARKGAAKGKLLLSYDILVFSAVCIGCGYMALNLEALLFLSKPVETHDMVIGVITILAVIELVRRTLGKLLAGLIVLLFLYAMFSNYFPGILWSTGFSLKRMIGQSYVYQTGMFGNFALLLAKIVVMMFLFVGLISASGAMKFLMDVAQSMFGRMVGGPAKVAVVASGMVGAIAPAGGPNVALTGSITIPLMKRTGLQGEYAGAVETVASIGGAIMPPVIGISGLMMCNFLNIGYQVAIAAALIPGLLYYTYLFLMVHFDCVSRGVGKTPAAELPPFGKTLKQGWQYVLPLVILVLALTVRHASIQKAALFAVAALLIVGQFRKEDRLTPKRVVVGCRNAMRLTVLIGPIIIGIGIMMSSLFITGVPLRLSALMVSVSGGNLFFLLLLAAFACFVLGTGLPTLASYLMLAVLVVPALIRMGVAPIGAHMFVIYTGLTHFITPPSMTATYIAASIANANPWRTAFNALRLGICMFFIPFLFVYNPSLLLVYTESVFEIIVTVMTATIGILAFTSGMAGSMLKRANWVQRILLVGAGILLMGPSTLINIAVGVSALLSVVLWQMLYTARPLSWT